MAALISLLPAATHGSAVAPSAAGAWMGSRGRGARVGLGVRAVGMEEGHRRAWGQKTDFWYGHSHTPSL